MPKKRLNAQYLDILKELRDGEEPYSNRWMTYNRAFRSLHDEKQEYTNVKDLKSVKYIGDMIVANIRKALENEGAPKPASPAKRKRSESSASDAKSSKGRAQKRSMTNDDYLKEPGDEDLYGLEYGMNLPMPPSQLSFGIPHLLQEQDLSLPRNLSRPENRPFEFFFVDSDHRSVLQHDCAQVDIHANMCWYRIRFSQSCIEDPLVGLFRLIPNSSRNGGVMEAWIKDEDVIEFNLQNATGISGPSIQSPPVINNAHNAMPKPSEASSLTDLLRNEKKSKNRTLDPTRSLHVDGEWQVPTSSKTNGLPKDRIKAAASHGISTGPAGPRPVGIPLISPEALLPTPPPTQVVQQTFRHVAAENPVAPVQSAKAKGKRPIRGRTSEFVPAPLPTDEFDLELERQSSSQPPAVGVASHVTADLIDDITDLTNPHTRFSEFDPIVFQPGSFEITLILDNREVKSQTNRDYVYNALKRRQINVEQRSLVLGDVLWIAKCHLRSGAGVGHECVLGYILERKRLDDLCESIKDGRFLEQKFRLTNTGLKVFYLVEQYDTQKHQEIFGVQIDTARSSTQVVDGFILKETRGLDASIDYLATMHKTIVEMYHNKPLHIIPPNLVKRHSYLALQKHLKHTKPDIPHLTSYGCFERLNNKTANLTTRDIFAQMLLCIKGVSAEKAAVLIDNFPTMRSLWGSFEAADRVEEACRNSNKPPKAKEMLCRLEGEGRKHFGPALSTNIYNLFRK